MSKINAVRIVNLTYNYGSIHIGDETLHLNGESTLINLENGGGKSVLIQMLTSLFVQKRYRNVKDRTFASYFTDRIPTHIMVEWVLDQNAGFLLTGLMVRRNQRVDENNDEELELLAYVSEYQKPCPQDLIHMPVVQRESSGIRICTFAECREEMNNFKKTCRGTFNTYDLTNSAQSRQYFEKLGTYGIMYKEWQSIIRRVNEEESGLSKLFSSCRDETELITKWFLPAVEDKLNQQTNQIAGFQDTVEKHVRQYRENMDKLRSRDSILKFNEEAAALTETVTKYESATSEVAERLNRIAAYSADLKRLLDDTRTQCDVQQAAEARLASDLNQVDYEERSADYYVQADRMADLDEQLELLSHRQTAQETELAKLQNTLHVLECARQQMRVNDDRLALARIIQSIDVCRQEQADLIPERDYLGFILRTDAMQKLDATQSAIEQNRSSMETNTSQQRELEQHREQLTHDSAHLYQVLGQIEKSLEGYEDAESRFSKKWRTRLVRNMLDHYTPTLEQHEKVILDTVAEEESSLAKSEHDLAETDRMRDLEGRHLRDCEAESAKLNGELAKAELQHAQYSKELEERRIILQYLDLPEDALFDLSRIIRTCTGKVGELDRSIQDLTTGIARLEDQIGRLATGKNTPLTDEQIAMFDALGIPIVYGMEWLKRNGADEAEKRALVDRLPFLPYALLLSGAEWQRLLQYENGAYTTQPIPIVLREELAAAGTPSAASEPPHFYMLFNHELLSETKVQEMLSVMQTEKSRKYDSLAHFKSAHQDAVVRLNTAKGHTVTKEALEKSERTMDKLSVQLQEVTDKIELSKAEVVRLGQLHDTLVSEIPKRRSQIQTYNLKLTDLRILMEQYSAYLTEKASLQSTREEIGRIQTEKASLGEQIDLLSTLLTTLQSRQAELTVQLRQDQAEMLIYESYTEVPAPESLDSSLTADINSVKARFKAITEGVSRHWQELEAEAQEARQRHQHSQEDLDHLAVRYGLTADDWASVQYSSADEDQADANLRFCRKTLSDIQRETRSLEMEAARTEERMANITDGIQKACHMSAPTERSSIPDIDFKARKAELADEISGTQASIQKLTDYAQMVDSNLTSLAKYQYAEVLSPVEWAVPLSSLGRQEMRTLTGQLTNAHDQAIAQEHEMQSRLIRQLSQTAQEEVFQTDEYRSYFAALQSLTDTPDLFHRQLTVISQSLEITLREVQIAIDVVEEERERIISMLFQYLEKVHTHLSGIDKCSKINVRGRNINMLLLTLPSFSDNQLIYRTKVAEFMEDITRTGIELLDRGESFHDFIGNHLTTRLLVDNVIGLHNLHIELYKIEQNRERQISWEMALRNSGGEGFLSSFVILACLLDFMRYDENEPFAVRHEGKVLMMDNPFAQTTAAHLLKPMTDLSKTTNTQLICFTAIHGDSILNQFDNIYILELVPSSFGSERRLKSTHVTGSKSDVSLTHMDIHPYGEQIEMPF